MSATKSVEKTFIKHLNFEPKQYFSFNLKSLNLSKSIVLNDLALLLKSKHCSVPLNSMMISKKRCMSKSVKNFFLINRSYLECSRNRDQKQQTFLRTQPEKTDYKTGFKTILHNRVVMETTSEIVYCRVCVYAVCYFAVAI